MNTDTEARYAAAKAAYEAADAAIEAAYQLHRDACAAYHTVGDAYFAARLAYTAEGGTP